MKCPHCGMNIRDDITECGYCGGKIVHASESPQSGTGRPNLTGGGAGAQGAAAAQPRAADQESAGDDEEEGGLSVYLQDGEHILIGSLNITVKKFFFHAYLTDRRIFLIDTQEKKVKVTAKDIPRESIIGSIVEISETSDPVLVLSIRSADDEIKTMKLVFVQNGMERSREIDEWIALLHEEEKPVSPPAPPVVAEPLAAMQGGTIAAAEAVQPEEKADVMQKRTAAKDHERQPPVRRYPGVQAAQEPPAPVRPPVQPTRRVQVREVPAEESPAAPAVRTVRRREVQSAMKVAMKSAMQPLRHHPLQQVRREPQEPAPPPVREAEDTRQHPPSHRRTEKPRVQEEVPETPQFCHNCGKRLPVAANFCPMCGTKVSLHYTLPHARIAEAYAEKRGVHHPSPAHEKRGASQKGETDEEEQEEESSVPVKPPIKKVPRGSEMTILHKFLRR